MQVIGDEARDEIGRRSRRKGHDDPDAFCRPLLPNGWESLQEGCKRRGGDPFH